MIKYIFITYAMCMMLFCQESLDKRVKQLEEHNRQLQAQLKKQNEMFTKFQQELESLQKQIKLLSKDKQVKKLSDKEKKAFLKKIQTQNKELTSLQKELISHNATMKNMVIFHHVLSSFHKNIISKKREDILTEIDAFLKKQKIAAKHQVKSNDKKHQNFRSDYFIYEFSINDNITHIIDFVHYLEERNVMLSNIQIYPVKEEIKVHITFAFIDISSLQKTFDQAKKLCKGIKMTKELQKMIKQSSMPTWKFSSQKLINIFSSKRNFPLSVITESRISMPKEKTTKTKPTKKKKKVVAKRITINTDEDAQKILKTLSEEQAKIKEKLKDKKNAAQVVSQLKAALEEIARIHIATTLQQSCQTLEKNPIVLNKIELSETTIKINKNNTKAYTLQLECFYFATSPYPVVALIKKLSSSVFSTSKMPRLKYATTYNRKGYKFTVELVAPVN